MKLNELVNESSNSTVYKRLRKMLQEHNGTLSCSRCPYHKAENYGHKIKRNWKKYRKTQYK